jgi:hypothetical protein
MQAVLGGEVELLNVKSEVLARKLGGGREDAQTGRQGKFTSKAGCSKGMRRSPGGWWAGKLAGSKGRSCRYMLTKQTCKATPKDRTWLMVV